MKSTDEIIQEHVPVLLAESVGALAIDSDGIYVDGTLGGAGHAEEIVKQLSSFFPVYIYTYFRTV